MEQNDSNLKQESSHFTKELTQKKELQLQELAKEYLKESAKWSFFLAIMGFIGIGFMVIASLFIGSFFSTGLGKGAALGGIISGIYILLAILYFFPVYYLYKYASDLKTALFLNDSEGLTTAFRFLKSHHKFLGISIIVILSLYLLLIIGFVIFGISTFIHNS